MIKLKNKINFKKKMLKNKFELTHLQITTWDQDKKKNQIQIKKKQWKKKHESF